MSIDVLCNFFDFGLMGNIGCYKYVFSGHCPIFKFSIVFASACVWSNYHILCWSRSDTFDKLVS